MSRSVHPPSVFILLVLVTMLAPACTSILGDYHVVDEGEGGAGGQTSTSSRSPGFSTTTTTTTTGNSGPSGPGGNSGPGGGVSSSSAAGGGTCADGALSGNETDLDCGGDCPPCPDGSACGSLDVNCKSKACFSGLCVQVAATCMNGLQDLLETDIDCGGAVCPGCALGEQCESDDDCASNHCSAAGKRCFF